MTNGAAAEESEESAYIQTDWDLGELDDLCRAKGRECPSDLLSSLIWKQYQSELHAEEANRIWKELLSSGGFSSGDERFTRSNFLYAAHVECCAHCLRSMIDIMAQIINVVILEKKFDVSKVFIWEIYSSLKEDNKRYEKIRDSLKSLITSESFTYLDDFCNKNKHRGIIKHKFHAEYGFNKRNESGVVFEKFNFKNKDHPEMWGSDIIGKHREQMLSMIADMGISINECIKDI
jgi:hypothetical protein